MERNIWIVLSIVIVSFLVESCESRDAQCERNVPVGAADSGSFPYGTAEIAGKDSTLIQLFFPDIFLHQLFVVNMICMLRLASDVWDFRVSFLISCENARHLFLFCKL